MTIAKFCCQVTDILTVGSRPKNFVAFVLP